jgi:hypothetical protein
LSTDTVPFPIQETTFSLAISIGVQADLSPEKFWLRPQKMTRISGFRNFAKRASSPAASTRSKVGEFVEVIQLSDERRKVEKYLVISNTLEMGLKLPEQGIKSHVDDKQSRQEENRMRDT